MKVIYSSIPDRIPANGKTKVDLSTQGVALQVHCNGDIIQMFDSHVSFKLGGEIHIDAMAVTSDSMPHFKRVALTLEAV